MNLTTDAFALTPGLRDFISGAVAGAFAITVSQPLDTVRVRLQQASQSTAPSRNALGVLMLMVRQEGILSPFKGLTYPLLFASVQSAILFQAYGWTLRQMASHNSQLPSQQQQQQQPKQENQNQKSEAPSRPSANDNLTALSRIQPCTSSMQAHLPASGHTVPSALHHLHLHHHHHLQDQEMAAVHASSSVSLRALTWLSSHLSVVAPSATTSTYGKTRLQSSGASPPPPPPLPQAVATQVVDPSHEHDVPCSSSSSGRENSGDGVMTDCRSGSDRRDAAAQVEAVEEASSPSSTSSSAYLQSSQHKEETALKEQQRQGQGHQRGALPTPWHGFIAGSVSGFAQVFLWSPVELLKLRAQLQTAAPGSAGYKNPAALAAQVLKQDGVIGLYRGFTLTVIRDVPSYAMYFWLYHDIAGALSPGIHPEAAPPTTQVIAGGLAGVIAWLPIYPLDVLKTRVQAVTATASKGKSWLHFAREMYKEAGAHAFFRGIAPTLVRAFMMDGASFLGYTTTLKLLGGAGEGAPEGSGSDVTPRQ